jgi:2-haloacid dehalogenase
LTKAASATRWAPRFLSNSTDRRQAGVPGHEDPQLAQVLEVASPRLPRDPPPGPHLRHQQDEPPVQGAPGLTLKAAPTAVIFDVGNVLYGWDPDSFLVRQIADDAARLRFVEETDLYGWHETLDGGRPYAEAAAELSEKFPQYADLIAAWSARFGETITGPVPGVHAIVEALDARDVPLFAITNFSADFWAPFFERERAFFRQFRDIVVSGEVKMLKPDPAIYYLALDRFRLHPSQALFVDDRTINVAAAEAVGMHAHLFTTADDLQARLRADGLL